MILILGMPRSGTSYICEILETLGYNFNLKDNNILDDFYKPNTKYFQHKDLHLNLFNTCAKEFKKVKLTENEINTIVLPDCDIIKEPYLLFVLHHIKHKIKKIILMVRNPNEVIISCRNFMLSNSNYNNNDINQKVNYELWNKYYLYFLKFLKEIKEIPFVIINYNNLKNNYEYEINRLKQFLFDSNTNNTSNTSNTSNNILKFSNENNLTLDNLPSHTKYIYINLISENKINYYKILENYEKFKNIKPNDLCFCDSKKKYKKCCFQKKIENL